MNPIRRWLQFDVKRDEEALILSITASRRKLHILRRAMYFALALVVAGTMMVQYQRHSRLQTSYASLESRALALLRERDDLKWRADAWEKEAVDWRHKHGINDENSQLTPDNQFYEPPQAPTGE